MLHFVGGGTAAAVVETAFGPEMGLAAAIALGSAKELYDQLGAGTAEAKDFYSTLAGGIMTYRANLALARDGSAWFIVPDGVVFVKRF